MRLDVVLLVLVSVFGGVGVSLVVTIFFRQRAILDRLENLLIEIETETRATAHKVGVEADVEAASPPPPRKPAIPTRRW